MSNEQSSMSTELMTIIIGLITLCWVIAVARMVRIVQKLIERNLQFGMLNFIQKQLTNKTMNKELKTLLFKALGEAPKERDGK
jgi:hypothetical protein